MWLIAVTGLLFALTSGDRLVGLLALAAIISFLLGVLSAWAGM